MYVSLRFLYLFVFHIPVTFFFHETMTKWWQSRCVSVCVCVCVCVCIYMGFANLPTKNMKVQVNMCAPFYMDKNTIHLYYLKLITWGLI